MTRRTFVAAAACAGSARARIQAPEFGCDLIDPGTECVLRESLRGFAGAMPGAINIPADQELLRRQKGLFYVVPGAGAINHDLGLRLAQLVDRGGWLVFESAAGFAGETAFRTQREVLAAHFGLAIGRPLDLWERGGSIVPYVDYAWPAAVKIRDFSRVVPVRCEPTQGIGSIAGHTVGVRRRLGRGVLVFLGSPMGPLLGTGDGDARRWLKCLLALAVNDEYRAHGALPV